MSTCGPIVSVQVYIGHDGNSCSHFIDVPRTIRDACRMIALLVFAKKQTQYMQQNTYISNKSEPCSPAYVTNSTNVMFYSSPDNKWLTQCEHSVFGLSKATSNIQFRTHEGHQNPHNDLPKSHEFVEVFRKQRV